MREPVAASQCRRRFRERLDLIAARYPPRIAVDLDHRADLLLARRRRDHRLQVIKEKKALAQQLMLYREFIRAAFLDT